MSPSRSPWCLAAIFVLMSSACALGGSGSQNEQALETESSAKMLNGAYTSSDIGSVGLAGSYSVSGGVHTLRGAGADIWTTSDGFRYAYESLTGDGTLTARVVSLTNTNATAKAGVMMRESLAANSRNVMALLTPTAANSYRFQTRSSTGGTTSRPATTGTASPPGWVRVTRSGNTFSAFSSSNGTTWSTIGAPVTVTMGATIFIGLAVTSHNTGALATAVFDNVLATTPTPPPPPPPPTGFVSQDIGSVGVTGSWAVDTSGVHTLRGSGNDIYGTADAFRFTHKTVTGDVTIIARVNSLQNTNTWSKAVVMIREDLAAGSRNVAAVVSPTATNKYRLQVRSQASQSTTSTASSGSSAIPTWLRLVRSGNSFTASFSSNGSSWSQIASTTLSMASSVRVGIGVTSHVQGTLATAIFSNVSVITPTPPPQDTGAPDVQDAGAPDASADVVADVSADVPDTGLSPDIEVSAPELIFSAIRATRSVTRDLIVRNRGTSRLDLNAPSIVGPSATIFVFEGTAHTAFNLAPGAQATLRVTFTPTSTTALGPNNASLRLVSNDADQGVLDVALWGLCTIGSEGANEPPLKQVVDTLGYNINVGGTALVLGTGAGPIGEEVLIPRFQRATVAPVTLRPVARYSPNERLPYGIYTTPSGTPVQQDLGAIALGQFQTLLPVTEAGTITSFDPGAGSFGVFARSAARSTYGEDAFNTGTIRHAIRVYPLKNRAGQLVANSYLIGVEEAANGDYNDYVYVITNVIPAQ